jgi:ubiquinone/menaquinone biosynthesis C-methylase UbiE
LAKNNASLFNTIAPVYGLFYQYQRKGFEKVAKSAKDELGLPAGTTILDVGCGTGVLCSVLHEMGYTVTGVDSAEIMLKVARKNPQNAEITFSSGDALAHLPFEDKSFDIAIASYVAHGLRPEERKLLYAEMGRVAKRKVIIYDYNQKRSFLTSLVEWLEQGDYFRFIRVAENEMKNCVSQMRECFSDVRVVQVGPRAAWYIATPR